jgi:hypothetical protein
VPAGTGPDGEKEARMQGRRDAEGVDEEHGGAVVDWRPVVLRLTVYVALLLGGAWLLIGRGGSVGVALWLLAAAGGLAWLVRWHAHSYCYRCPYDDCGALFAASSWVDFIAPQRPTRDGGRKYLRCPRCGRWGWARIVPREELPASR